MYLVSLIHEIHVLHVALRTDGQTDTCLCCEPEIVHDRVEIHTYNICTHIHTHIHTPHTHTYTHHTHTYKHHIRTHIHTPHIYRERERETERERENN